MQKYVLVILFSQLICKGRIIMRITDIFLNEPEIEL